MSLPPYFRAEVVNEALEVEWLRGPVESVPLALALAAPDLLAIVARVAAGEAAEAHGQACDTDPCLCCEARAAVAKAEGREP